ncbi:MAG TPA: hypothetical protein DEO49_01075 [Sutterella sp.]|jgi:uncharacterized protein (TIGR00156 family)|nr:hypothetical protein [Sutterella sp.]
MIVIFNPPSRIVMSKLLPIIAAAAVALTGNLASAQFVSANTTSVTTVKKVLQTGRDDQLVVLEGRITEQFGRKKYFFADKTGTIVAEIDDQVFAGRKVTPQNRLRVQAEVDKDRGQDAEIDVLHFDILK